MALGTSVCYKTWPPIGWHHPFVIGCYKTWPTIGWHHPFVIGCYKTWPPIGWHHPFVIGCYKTWPPIGWHHPFVIGCYKTWPPIGWHHPFVIGWSKYRLKVPQSQWIVDSPDGWEFPPYNSLPQTVQSPNFREMSTIWGLQGDCEKSSLLQLVQL